MKCYHGDLYNRIYQWNSIMAAYQKTIHNKKTRRDMAEFNMNLLDNLIEIHHILKDNQWSPQPYKHFRVWNSHKMRDIECPSYRDRVIHNCIIMTIEPMVQSKFIRHTYSCIKDRGTHKAINHTEKLIRMANENAYVLKCDIHHYFPSINLPILMNLYKTLVFTDPKMLKILEVASQRPGYTSDTGIPIGSRPSQLSANLYLTPFDRFVTEELKFGSRYVRYADDFLFVDNDKKKLQDTYYIIRDYLYDKFKLTLNKKSGLFPIKKGVDFCGYRIFRTHRLPRKKVVQSFVRKLKHYTKTKRFKDVDLLWGSFFGYMSHCNCFNLLNSIRKIILDLGYIAPKNRVVVPIPFEEESYDILEDDDEILVELADNPINLTIEELDAILNDMHLNMNLLHKGVNLDVDF